MLEKTIEKKLTREMKVAGGVALKLTCPGTAGMPDRLILFPGGKVAFIEVKRPGEKPRALQVARHRMLKNLGFKVYVVDDEKKIGEIISEIQSA